MCIMSFGYLQVFGLGFVSVFDQVLEGLPEGDKGALFSAYIGSLGENGDQYRQVQSWAPSLETGLLSCMADQCSRFVGGAL